MSLFRNSMVWVGLTTAIVVPVFAAATSPLLAWRSSIYVGAGFAGVLSMALLLLQPVLAAGFLPGITGTLGRRFHRWAGAALIVAVVFHVGGLWITSPPDVIDALLFFSPTPFSAWGVVAMWAVFAAAGFAVFRKRLQMHPRIWRRMHTGFASVVVGGSVVHAMLIEGTMEVVTKTLLCVLVVVATVKALIDLKVWAFKRDTR